MIIEYNRPFFLFLKTHDWRVFWDSIGGLLVTGGVAGEFFVEFKAHRKEKKLRTIHARLEAEADKRLRFADERIAQAQNDAERARRDAEALRLEISKTNERAASAEQKAAEATLAAEREQMERVKLEKQFAFRRLTPEQQERIISKLTKIPKGYKFFVYVCPDPDSLQLMQTMQDLMISLGWEQITPPGLAVVGGKAALWIGEGVRVHFASSRVMDMGVIAMELVAAMQDENIEADVTFNEDLEKTPDALNLLVGSRPALDTPPFLPVPRNTPN